MKSPDFGSILKRSWELTWKNKWLWVYGVVLAALGGAGGGGGNGGGGGSSDLQKNLSPEGVENSKKVLGAASDVVSYWFSSVPITTWLLLGLGIFLLIVLGIVVNMIIQAWAKGALITALDEADKGQAVTLKSTPPRGTTKIKQLVILSAISAVLVLGIGLISLLLILFGLIVFRGTGPGQVIWFALVGVVAVLSLIIAMILTTAANVYAERLVVLFNMTPWQAWKKGLTLSRRSFLYMVVMGIINSTISCSVGCLGLIVLGIVLGVPAVVLLVPSFKDGFHLPSPAVIMLLGVLFFVGIGINLLMRAIVVVFNYSNWNLFFKQVVAEEGGEKNA